MHLGGVRVAQLGHLASFLRPKLDLAFGSSDVIIGQTASQNVMFICDMGPQFEVFKYS